MMLQTPGFPHKPLDTITVYRQPELTGRSTEANLNPSLRMRR